MEKRRPRTFKDGIVDITQSDGKEQTFKIAGVRYRNEMLGVQRFYAAAAANKKIERVISIPFINGIEPEMIFTIRHDRHGNTGRYAVVQCQKIDSTAWPELKITLRAYDRVKTDWEETDYGI